LKPIIPGCPKHVNIFDVYFLKNKNLVFALENGLL